MQMNNYFETKYRVKLSEKFRALGQIKYMSVLCSKILTLKFTVIDKVCNSQKSK